MGGGKLRYSPKFRQFFSVEESDAVISLLGFTPKLFENKTTNLSSRGVSVFIEAMAQQKIKKLIFCTSAGVEDDPNKLWLYRHITKPFFLQKGYENRQVAEKIIAHSDTDWILVRPGRLTNGKLTTNFRVSERFRATVGYSISRADVAFFILQQVK